MTITVDPKIVGAGSKVGLELWRIENLGLNKLDKIDGKFHTGDAYILLSTTEKHGKLVYNLHYWLGSESTRDELGIAAYKTVEIDDYLGGRATQYREIEKNESQLFLSYFKDTGGIEYLPGGVESGFRHVEKDDYSPRLLHLKGQRTVRVSEVPVKLESLNSGDVFILDLGLTLFIFNGPYSNKFEKVKGIDVANRINNDERGGRAQIILLDDEPQHPEFWSHFGGYVDPNSFPVGEPDNDTAVTTYEKKLFRISNEGSDKVEFIQIPVEDKKKFSRALLDSNDVFLLQSTSGKIFVWIGKNSNLQEKKESMVLAVKYIKDNNLPSNTQIERVSESTESGAFISEFSDWHTYHLQKLAQQKADSKLKDEDIDIKALIHHKALSETPVDDGSGDLTIWVIDNFKKVELPKEQYGRFYAGDSYILLYNYKNKLNRDESIIYYWLGNDSTSDEKGAAALLTVELDNSLGGKPVQVRVTQGKEPSHFKQLFKSNMIVFKGGNASGFNREDNANLTGTKLPSIGLFHVKGTNDLNVCAFQVDATCSSLNSNDVFILVTPDKVYVWNGNGSNESERNIGQSLANTLNSIYNVEEKSADRDIITLSEDENDSNANNATFFELLGGRTEYAAISNNGSVAREARLFSASTATGKFKVEEIHNFDQSDLNDEDVFLLDTYNQLFVWVGSKSTQEEKEKADKFAVDYLNTCDDGRDQNIPIIKLTSDQDSLLFSSYFHGWDSDYFKKLHYKDPYAARLLALNKEKEEKLKVSKEQEEAEERRRQSIKKLEEKKVVAPAVEPEPLPTPPPAPSNEVQPVPGSFTYEQLKGQFPPGVIPTRREEYLSDDEFLKVFGTSRADFNKLAKWKKDDLKKKLQLF